MTTTKDRMPWLESAVCAQTDLTLFFSDPCDTATTAKAKSVCRPCPVRADCLAWSIETASWAGVFGGFTEDERRLAARRHARGVPLEVIIAGDDDVFRTRQEAGRKHAADLRTARLARRRIQDRARKAAARSAAA